MNKIIKNTVLLGQLALAFLTTQASAAQFIRGTYQGHGFTATIEPKSYAVVQWDDGAQGVTLNYDANPNPGVRCPCDIYSSTRIEGGRSIQRRIVAEFQRGSSQYTSVSYSKFDTNRFENSLTSVNSIPASVWVRGNYQGYGFQVFVVYRSYATLVWDDGTQGFTAYYNPSPNPAPRCPCEVYEVTTVENGRYVTRSIMAQRDVFNPSFPYLRVTYGKK